MVNLYLDHKMIVPGGSLLVGHVAVEDSAWRTNRKGRIAMQFTRLTVGGRTYEVRASVTKALESRD